MKKIFLTLFAFITVLYQSVIGMEDKHSFNKLPKYLKGMIFQNVASAAPGGNFINPLDLSLVCRDWYRLIYAKKDPLLSNATGYKTLTPLGRNYVNTWYGVTNENKEVFEKFLDAKLIYTHLFLDDVRSFSEQSTTEFKISDSPNPFFCSFIPRVTITSIRPICEKNLEIQIVPLFLTHRLLKNSNYRLELNMNRAFTFFGTFGSVDFISLYNETELKKYIKVTIVKMY